jgi:FMN phosphatase YigB (HAD superfamily)
VSAGTASEGPAGIADSIKSAFADPPVVVVTFDLFGTLVDADRPESPAAAVGAALSARGIAVPDDWAAAFREAHIDAPAGAEVPLPAHVAAALRSRGVDTPGNAARRAVVAAFDPDVRTRAGAVDAVAAAADRGPVGLLSNCSVPELVARTLIRSDLDREAFDATVTSVGCGWRKPHPNAFESIAEGLGVDADAITHVGDDPTADGGIADLGGTFVDVDDPGLETVAERLRAGAPPGGE